MGNNAETVFQSINMIGYQGPLLDVNVFHQAMTEGPKNVEYTKLVSFLSNELQVLCKLDECINAIAGPEDAYIFIMETSSFLNELVCPYPSLTQGLVSERLRTVEDRLLLVEHLATELMAARILSEKYPEKEISLQLRESAQALDLRKMLQTLGFPKPPENITMKTMMQKVIPAVQSAIEKAPADLIGKPLLDEAMSPEQWAVMEEVQQELDEDYSTRREMMMTRLDCTVESFKWSDKTKNKEEEFNKVYTEPRKSLKREPDVGLADLLAARDDLAIIEKTSSATVRKNTKSAVNEVIMGDVPDRGGRPSERAPAPEMPPWQQRSSGAGRGDQSRGGRSNYARGGGSAARRKLF